MSSTALTDARCTPNTSSITSPTSAARPAAHSLELGGGLSSSASSLLSGVRSGGACSRHLSLGAQTTDLDGLGSGWGTGTFCSVALSCPALLCPVSKEELDLMRLAAYGARNAGDEVLKDARI